MDPFGMMNKFSVGPKGLWASLTREGFVSHLCKYKNKSFIPFGNWQLVLLISSLYEWQKTMISF